MNTEQLIRAEAERNFGGCNPYDQEYRYSSCDMDDAKKEAWIEGATFGASLRDAEVKKLNERISELIACAMDQATLKHQALGRLNDTGWVSVKDDLPKGELLTTKVEAIDEYGNVSIIFGKSVIIRKLQFTHWRKIVKP